MPQCLGTTKQNQRCKINVANGKYCHHHTSQAPRRPHLLSSSPFPSKPNSSLQLKHQAKPNHSSKLPAPQRPSYKIQLSSSTEPPAPALFSSSTSPNTGYIYIYTLSHLLSKTPQQKDWLKIQIQHHDGFVSDYSVFDPKHFLLIKIGLTTQLVSKRINQWLNQCNHQISLIDPVVLDKIAPSSLSTLFSSLSIQEGYSSPSSFLPSPSKKAGVHLKNFLVNLSSKSKLKDKSLKTYNKFDTGFFCRDNLALIEKTIHKVLRSKFGKVEVECENCTFAISKATDSGSTNGNLNHFPGQYQHSHSAHSRLKIVHREWFLVPRERLIDVFFTVDEICYRYAMNGGKVKK